MAEEAAASAPPEGNAPAPEVAGVENANESSAAAAAEGANHVENPINDGNDNPGDAAGSAAELNPPPPAANAADGADAPPVDAAPDAAAAEGAAPLPALATDLSTYFATLRNTLQRQNGNSATGGVRSSMVVLLWDGVSPIVEAGNAAGRNNFGFEDVSAVGGNASAAGGGRAAMSPNQAALYLYAVAQNIVALEAAVLGSRPPNALFAAAAGGMMDGMGPSNVGGGVTAKQVAEIISAVSIAATFCNSRSIITQTGILPALAHLIESTGTIAPPPSAYMKSNNRNRRGSSSGVLHALTPFHPEFLQCCLLAGQYRFAQSFLSSRPASHTSLGFPYLRLDATIYLRTHYYAGMVHVGCDEWNAALDSFHLCLTMPCSSVSAISVAARKKSLLVQCLLLESEELDGNNNGGGNADKSNAPARVGGGKSQKSTVENQVLDLPGAASAAVIKYMAASSNRVGGNGGGGGGALSAGSGSAPERTAGSETSEQPSGRERHSSSRRRMRSANSNSSSDAAGGERGASSEGSSRTKNYSHLGSYHDLISTYISGNAHHTAKLLTEMTDLLHVDGNWGLAKRLEGRLAYRAVRKVASVYSVVGVDVLEGKMQEEVCSDLGSGSTGVGGEIVGKRGVEDLLMGMAACDAKDALLADPFVARMDHSTGMVSFLDYYDDDESSEDDDSHEQWMEADLSQRLESCIALAERVRDLDIGLTTSHKYQQHAMKEMMMKGDARASAMMKQQQGGSSVADIGHGPMDIGVDW